MDFLSSTLLCNLLVLEERTEKHRYSGLPTHGHFVVVGKNVLKGDTDFFKNAIS